MYNSTYDMVTWVEPAFGNSNINRCNLPQMKIIEHLYTMGYQGMNILFCILYKNNYVFYLLPGLELGRG